MPGLVSIMLGVGVRGVRVVEVREERRRRWSSRPQVGGGAEAQAELCLELPPWVLRWREASPPLPQTLAKVE